MKRLILLAMAVALVLGASGCGSSAKAEKPGSANAASKPKKFNRAATAKLITPVDAELVSGVAGIRLVQPEPRKGATGDVNFADGDNTLVFIVKYGDKKWYEQQKSSPIFLEPVEGIGDDAFFGPSKKVSPFVYQIAFLKGDTGAVISSYYTPDRAASRLSRQQLEELARRAAKKL